MIAMGEVERPEPSIYRLKASGHTDLMVSPEAIDEVVTLEAPPVPPPDDRPLSPGLVRDILADGETHHRSEIGTYFGKHDISVQTCDKTLMRMSKAHLIERLGGGYYRSLTKEEEHA